MTCGVLVGCDKAQEWMLPWWLANFRAHNKLPIAFIDLGMSDKTREWCKAQGYLISLRALNGFVFPKELITSAMSEKWEELRGASVWRSRLFWFYKPFALLQTPFEKTLWLDIDCEVLTSLEGLFQKLRFFPMALAKDSLGFYNTGVIVYKRDAPLLAHWAAACVAENDQVLSDQQVLMQLPQENVGELAPKYNWLVQKGVHPEAAVLHWAGVWGKEAIRRQIRAHC